MANLDLETVSGPGNGYMHQKMPGCCVPGCGNSDKSCMSFHTLLLNEKLQHLWSENIGNPGLSDQIYTTVQYMQVCRVHFMDIQYRTANRQTLSTGAHPVLFLPVLKEVDVREFVKGAVPPIFDDTVANSKQSSKPVESYDNDLETNSDKIVAEPEVRPAPIFVSSSADYKEVLTTSNKQPHKDCDPLKERLQNPRYSEQCKVEDLESSIQTQRNWNLAMNEISTLRKQVNILENQNRQLENRVENMKTLLRHFNKTHA